MAKSTALAKAPDADQLAALAAMFPAEEGFAGASIPRISYVSQDKIEKVMNPRTKKMEAKIIIDAGTFFREQEEKDANDKPVVDDETGKPIWDKEVLGAEIDVQIVFQRKQLKYFDQPTQTFVSSNVYDDNTEVVKLFQNKSEIAEGTPDELKSGYEAKDERTGKVKSLLEETKVLFVALDGVLHMMNVRGSSMWALKKYLQGVRPSAPAVITHISSEPKEAGSNKWNCMTFDVLRPANADEVVFATESIADIKRGIEDRNARSAQKAAANDEFNNFGKKGLPEGK